MNVVQRAVRVADRLQQRHAWLAVPVAVWKKFGDDRAGNLAALVAYYAFVAIFPLLLVLVTVLEHRPQERSRAEAAGPERRADPVPGGRPGP